MPVAIADGMLSLALHCVLLWWRWSNRSIRSPLNILCLNVSLDDFDIDDDVVVCEEHEAEADEEGLVVVYDDETTKQEVTLADAEETATMINKRSDTLQIILLCCGAARKEKGKVGGGGGWAHRDRVRTDSCTPLLDSYTFNEFFIFPFL
ncbi:predicted protein [Thalassiosira pseudonana CCMP1335]|uniref:Uncharacterized protein n=1 Tax=Thalassiosira pseudonana TaxID=35128 RepID=B8C9B1_THAPS|nr:predicted protein [Thalassiosira pseudonana CCMP1335]EED90015.1 predicted protein [Thalassiosira pseudonana CCMP1335]